MRESVIAMEAFEGELTKCETAAPDPVLLAFVEVAKVELDPDTR